MASERSLWATALRGLAHPFCWLAIGILLLNDHVLKQAAPSTLTGKLSDFAGLFFFPFLAAAVWGLLLDRCRPSAQWSAPLIFILTGVWFATIKTLPWANALTVTALTRVVGSAQIVRDPTDLIALAALWPAWRLWRRLESAPPEPPGRRAVVALALASLATMATSCAPVLNVERLMVFENRLYAWVSELTRGGGGSLTSPIIQSDDGGKTWQSIALEKTPPKVAEELQQYVTLPVTDCDPQSPQICYRVSGTEIVEGSTDGGQTWDVVWKIPAGRRKFIERYLYAPPCGKGFDFGPYDLALLPTADGTVLVVATGSEGVLVRTLDGQWQRRSVLTAEPTPYSDSGLGPVRGEIALLLMGAFFTWIVATTIAWGILLPQDRASTGKLSWLGIVPTLAGILLLISAVGFLFLEIESSETSRYENYSIIFWAIPGITLIGVALSWWRVRRLSPAPSAVTLSQWVCGLLPLAMLSAGLPFDMWVRGVIAVYEVALGAAIAIVLGVLGVGYVALRRISALMSMAAPQETEPETAPTSLSLAAPQETMPSTAPTSLFLLLAWIVVHLVSSASSAPFIYVGLMLLFPTS